MKFTNIILLAFTTLIISCGGPNYADNPLIQKAFAIHQEASKVEKEIAPKMKDLIQIKTSLNIVGRDYHTYQTTFNKLTSHITKYAHLIQFLYPALKFFLIPNQLFSFLPVLLGGNGHFF